MITGIRNWWVSLLVLCLLTACQDADTYAATVEVSQDSLVTLTVVYTNDEHGWILGEEEGKGAAELAGQWAVEYAADEALLILSGGDNWTGPAISTWFEGEGMVEVMNAMSYVASAVGNHEFDFGLDGLKARTDQAEYPYLGANIRYKADGTVPVDLGIHPYTIVELAGLKIGLIGLANVDTPVTTDPRSVASFYFTGYAETLREIVPEVRASGADLIFVPGHVCTWELAPLARDVADLGITLFGGGHCHETYADTIAGSVILSGGSFFGQYAYATFEIDPRNVEILNVDYGIVPNNGGTPHPQVAEIAAYWQQRTDEELTVEIGYLAEDIPQRSDEMAALITESWLLAYPADVALTNWGGMRDRIPAGTITYASIINSMPFDNVLVDVTLTGSQLEQVLNYGIHVPPVAGVHLASGHWILDRTGMALDPEESYTLLVTDFLYFGGDDYTMLAEYEPEAYNTAISWRQPVIDWILAQDSSTQNPLDEAVMGLME